LYDVDEKNDQATRAQHAAPLLGQSDHDVDHGFNLLAGFLDVVVSLYRNKYNPVESTRALFFARFFTLCLWMKT
jgi:hypothetical protein